MDSNERKEVKDEELLNDNVKIEEHIVEELKEEKKEEEAKDELKEDNKKEEIIPEVKEEEKKDDINDKPIEEDKKEEVKSEENPPEQDKKEENKKDEIKPEVSQRIEEIKKDEIKPEEKQEEPKEENKKDEPKENKDKIDDLENIYEDVNNEEDDIEDKKDTNNPTLKKLKAIAINNETKNEDEKDSLPGLKRYQTDSILPTKGQDDPERKKKLQNRLLKARQLAKKKQEEAKYKKSNDINKRASVFEGLFKNDQNTTNEEQK